jgi:hypothetical protein
MAEQFNTVIKDLFKTFKDLPSGFKSKLHITELQSKMIAGMRTEPEYAIAVLGPHLWAARAEIARRDANFFLTRRYEVDLQRMCREHDVCYDDAINTVTFMKDAYRSAPDATKTLVMDKLTELLKIVAARELAKRTPAKK